VVVRPAVAAAPRRQRRRAGGRALGDIGAMAGAALAGPVGGRLGRLAGTGIARIMGRGDYVLSNPVRGNTLSGNTPPMFGDATGTTRIRHREFISDISGSTDFKCQQYHIQPGLSQLFPWLCRLASSYEQYRIMGLVVEFKSTSATALNSTNTALGVVGLVTQYDAHEPVFQSKQEAENYLGCQSSNPSQSMLHFVECAKGQNPLEKLYVRTTATGEGADVKFYDMGILNLFTTGMQAAAVIGELWVSYDIEFSKPKLPTGGVSVAGSDVYSLNDTPIRAGDIVSVLTYPSFGNLGTTLGVGNAITFPKELAGGEYHVWVEMTFPTSTSGLSIITSWSYTEGITLVNRFVNQSNAAVASRVNSSVTTTTQFAVIAISLPNYRNEDSVLSFTLGDAGVTAHRTVIGVYPVITSSPVTEMNASFVALSRKLTEMQLLYKRMELRMGIEAGEKASFAMPGLTSYDEVD